MAELAKIPLANPIEVGGAPKSELVVRHYLTMGDLSNVQLWAMAHAAGEDVGALLERGVYGAILTLAESLCDLAPGSLSNPGQLDPGDFQAVAEGIGPFSRSASQRTGAPSVAPSPSSAGAPRP